VKLDTFRSKIMSFGPLGYWRLNNQSYATAADGTGFANHGAYSSPEIDLLQNVAPGLYGAAFPGADSGYVTLPNVSAFRIPVMSGVLTLKDNGSIADGRLILFSGESPSSPGWEILRDGASTRALVSVSTSAGVSQGFAFPGTPFDGARHTLAWGFDRQLVYTSTDFSPWSTAGYAVGSGPVPNSDIPFYVGRGSASGQPAKGVIADVAIFPYVLLNSQLSALSAALSSGNDGLEYALLTANKLLIADLFTVTLADGTILRWTSFDFDVAVGAETFSSIGPRLRRGALKWKRGVESSPLELKVASASTDIASLGLTVAQAIAGGYFNGATVRLQRAYNPTRNANGTYSASSALLLFQGWVGKIEQGRPYATITVNSLLERLHLQWPFTMLQPSCRWTLFDAGCGLTQAGFAVTGSVQSGSSRSQILHTLTNPTGYFDQGRIKFTSGSNNGLWRVVQAGTASGAVASYRQAVLNDSPAGYWRMGDAPGSGTVADDSGAGNNGAVHGGVTLGQPGVPAGDTGTAALFDGTSGYITLPLAKPSGFAKGISIEFWFKLPAGSAASQPVGIFDTSPSSPFSLRNFNGGGSGPAFQWGKKGQPAVGINQPAAGEWVHVAVVFRGQNAVDVYYNGQLYSSATAQGRGQIDWKNPITIGNVNGGSNGWFKGYLQELAIYPYAMSADQPLAHYSAGTTPPSTNGDGMFALTQPLPYAPAAGDTFVVYPGCDKSQRTCQIKFGNLANFGGFPYVPAPETAA
jgi:hypothetical protein